MAIIDKAGAGVALVAILLMTAGASALSPADKCETSKPAGPGGAVLAWAPLSYVDNGDGTITDSIMGLTWEKLSNDSTIHDYATMYTSTNAFAVKIAMLNSSRFAGHNDWRLPNRVELATLPPLGRVFAAIDSAFDTSCTANCTVLTCSCTQSDYDWSSTTFHGAPSYAWGVYFNDGVVVAGNRSTTCYVRAVRSS
jgi:hypothetical protein